MLIRTVSLRFFVRWKVIESELEEPFPDGLSKQPDRCFGGDLFGLAWAGMVQKCLILRATTWFFGVQGILRWNAGVRFRR